MIERRKLEIRRKVGKSLCTDGQNDARDGVWHTSATIVVMIVRRPRAPKIPLHTYLRTNPYVAHDGYMSLHHTAIGGETLENYLDFIHSKLCNYDSATVLSHKYTPLPLFT